MEQKCSSSWCSTRMEIAAIAILAIIGIWLLADNIVMGKKLKDNPAYSEQSADEKSLHRSHGAAPDFPKKKGFERKAIRQLVSAMDELDYTEAQTWVCDVIKKDMKIWADPPDEHLDESFKQSQALLKELKTGRYGDLIDIMHKETEPDRHDPTQEILRNDAIQKMAHLQRQFATMDLSNLDEQLKRQISQFNEKLSMFINVCHERQEAAPANKQLIKDLHLEYTNLLVPAIMKSHWGEEYYQLQSLNSQFFNLTELYPLKQSISNLVEDAK